MVRVASGDKTTEELTHKFIIIQKRNHPSIKEKGMLIDMFNTNTKVVKDWRQSIRPYLEHPYFKTPYKIKM